MQADIITQQFCGRVVAVLGSPGLGAAAWQPLEAGHAWDALNPAFFYNS